MRTIILKQNLTKMKVSYLEPLENCLGMYRNDAKFSNRSVWANSVDPDQTAPRGAV